MDGIVGRRCQYLTALMTLSTLPLFCTLIVVTLSLLFGGSVKLPVAVAIGSQVVSPFQRHLRWLIKQGDDVKIPVLADQFQRDSFLVTPDISLGVLGNVLQAVF